MDAQHWLTSAFHPLQPLAQAGRRLAMKRGILAAALTLASCDYRSGPLPDRSEIVRVEKALSGTTCIGPVGAWERVYRYHLTPNVFAVALSRLDRKVVDFKLLRAGKFARVGQTLLPPYPPLAFELDDTPTDVAWGSFNLRSGKLRMKFCGSNIPK